jgi:hypothetical protein
MRLAQGSVSTIDFWARRPKMVSASGQSLYREPLRLRVGVTSSQHGSATRVAGRYPGFIAPTGSCARPKSSHGLGITLVPRVCAGCCAPLLEVGHSRRYLRESFSRCLDPYPGSPHGAFARFFPRGFGLPPFLRRSALRKIPHNDFCTSIDFEAAVIHSCSGPWICSPPRSFLPQGMGISPHPRQP